MPRNMGPGVKGVVVVVNDDAAESTQLILEPLHCTADQYAAMLANGGSFSATVASDTAWPKIKYAAPSYGTVDAVTVTGSFVGVGDGSQVTFTKTFTETPVLRSSFVITAGGVTGTTNASTGAITGAGITSGSVTTQGVFTITFAAPVADGTPITATFTRSV